MNKQDFLDYLRDPVELSTRLSMEEINKLFGHQVKAQRIHHNLRQALNENEYFMNIYGYTPDILEDLCPRFNVILFKNLPESHTVMDKGIHKVFQIHHEYPPKWVREYYIGFTK